MSSFQEAIQSYEQFKTIFEQSNPPLQECKRLMDQLKLALTQFGFPNVSNIGDEQKRQLLFSRNILESGALLSIALKDVPAFERYVAQLKTHYNDYQKKLNLPPSSMQETILGLNLLRLLAKNKLDEFHTEIELLPPSTQDNLYIKHPLQLEQYMMEGSYNKVFQARQNVPSPYYEFFMETLMDTVRHEIADCIVKSYATLSLADAQKLLAFSNPTQIKEFAQDHEWRIVQNKGVEEFDFRKTDESTKVEIPANRLMRQALIYAKELERIV